MADLIDRQAAIDAIEKHIRVGDELYPVTHDDRVFNWGFEVSASCVYNLPSVEAEQVRQTAEWIYGEKDGTDGWYCSKCGFHIPWYYDYYGLNNINFIRDFHTCPRCDAKMLKYTGMEREQNA